MLFTKLDGQSLSRMMDTLASRIGLKTNPDWALRLVGVTADDVNLYVDGATGKDTNPGTSSAPFKTIQAAVDTVPKRIAHQVVITVAAGNYDGVVVSGFSAESSNRSAPAFMIQGTQIEATLASGLTSGAVASAVTGSGSTTSWGTLVATGAGWTVNDLRGKYVTITGGPGLGHTRQIADNTSDTVTIMGGWTSTEVPTSQSTFKIIEAGTHITGGGVTVAPFLPIYSTVASSSFTAGFVVVNNLFPQITPLSSTSESAFVVRRFVFDGAYSKGVASHGNSRLAVDECRFGPENSAQMVPFTFKDGLLLSRENNFDGTAYAYETTGGPAVLNPTALYSRGCLYRLGANGAAITAAGSSVNFYSRGEYFLAANSGTSFYQFNAPNIASFWFGGLRADGGGQSGTGIFIQNNANSYMARTSVYFSSCSVSNFSTAVWARGDCWLALQGLVGTGNTTAILLEKSARCAAATSTTITGTTEISLDGASHTLANMRAASPKVLRDANYGTMIFE